MSRYYKRHGRDFPSVTTIVGLMDKSQGLMPWVERITLDAVLRNVSMIEEFTPSGFVDAIESARGERERVLEETAAIGSEFHALVERSLLKPGYVPDNHEGQVFDMLTSWQEWADDVDLEPVLIEKAIYGDNYAGTLDTLAHITIKGKRKLYAIDWKTSASVQQAHKYQIAAYRHCLESCYGYNVDGCAVVSVQRKAPYKVKMVDVSRSYENNVEVFKRLVDLWWQCHPKKRDEFGYNNQDMMTWVSCAG